MADPVSSIVGFTITVIGLLATIRNGVGTIVSDRARYQKWDKDLLPFYFELEIASESMEKWTKFWMIEEGVRPSLLIRYWGFNAAQSIAISIAGIHSILQELRVEFNDRYRPKRFGSLYPLDDPKSSDTAASPRLEMIKVDQLRTRFEKYRKRFGLHQQLYLALFQSKIFQTRLSGLRHSVNQLIEISHLAYQRKWGSTIGLTDDMVLHIRMQYYLCRTNDVPKETLDILSDKFKSSVEIDWQIDQSYGGELATERSDVISRRILRQDNQHCLLTSAESGRYVATVTIRIGPEKFRVEQLPSGSTLVDTLEDALNEAVEESEFGPRRSSFQRDIFVRRREHAMRFLLSQFQHCQTAHSTSLRNLIDAERISSALQVAEANFLIRERLKLAYEMAESLQMFLKTNWFSNMCACKIRRTSYENLQDKYDYWLRISNVGDHDHSSPLCERTISSASYEGSNKQRPIFHDSHLSDTSNLHSDLEGRHIRRFGHILIDIATGSTVLNQAFDKKMEIPKRDVMKLLAGDDYVEVVEYCLAQNITPEQITKDHIANFYHHVVSRLHVHYRARVERYDRLRSIAAASGVEAELDM